MQNTKRLEELILLMESIFFVPEAMPVNYSQINSDMEESYSPLYEKNVRRTHLFPMMLLDEICSELGNGQYRSSDALWDLENIFFSADFYRKLIFDGHSVVFKDQLRRLNGYLQECSTRAKGALTEEQYQDISASFSHLKPAPTKDEFLIQLDKIKEFLHEKLVEIESYERDNQLDKTGTPNPDVRQAQ